jgi:SAM-dependent methyltransferase
MNWRQLVPAFLKPVLRPVHRTVGTLTGALRDRPRRREECHAYWKAPDDGCNLPEFYLQRGHARSEFLVQLIRRHLSPDAHVLEIGCNAGRNLHHLHRAGFTQLAAIEISENAVALLRESYPEMARRLQLHVGAVEDVIRSLADGQFDLVFTMAVLEHIHRDSEWVFDEMARVTRGLLITVEDEQNRSWRHFPRNYQAVFESRGLRQVEQVDCSRVLELSQAFVARVFRK